MDLQTWEQRSEWPMVGPRWHSASWFVQRITDQDGANQAATRRDITDLTVEVRELRALLAASGYSASDLSPAPDEPVPAGANTPGRLGS